MAHFDAIAVGGGLAGTAFALELARAGLRVAIVERTERATPKVCGDFLSCEAQELLLHLGVSAAAMGAAPIRMLRLVAGERSALVELPFSGAGLTRLRLDEALLEAAQAAGAVLVRGQGARALEPVGREVCVRVGAKVLTAGCAALATGKHNLRGFPRVHAAITAYRIGFLPSPLAARQLKDVVQLVGYQGGYIGACSVEDGLATIAWLLDARAMREVGPEWTAQLDHIARASSAIGDLLTGARYLTARPAAVSGVPFGFRRRTTVASNVYPVGDQLCVIPSFTGDGTSLALTSGAAAAHAHLSGVSAGDFQRDFLKRTGAQFVSAKIVDTAFKSAATRALGVRAVAALPALARLAASLTRVNVGASPARAPARARG